MQDRLPPPVEVGVRVLGHLFGFCAVADDPKRHAHHRPVVGVEQGSEVHVAVGWVGVGPKSDTHRCQAPS